MNEMQSEWDYEYIQKCHKIINTADDLCTQLMNSGLLSKDLYRMVCDFHNRTMLIEDKE